MDGGRGGRLRVTQGGPAGMHWSTGRAVKAGRPDLQVWCREKGIGFTPRVGAHLEFISQALKGTLGACRVAGGTS